MKKVVYNKDYGGFNLSPAALVMLRELDFPLVSSALASSGMKLEDFTRTMDHGYLAHAQFDMLYKDGQVITAEHLRRDMTLRSHPVLVFVVEQLGRAADGSCAELALYELGDKDVYKIKTRDGMERVEPLADPSYTAGYAYAADVQTTLMDRCVSLNMTFPAPPTPPEEDTLGM